MIANGKKKYQNFKTFYRPQRSWGKVIFLQASVILSTGGGSASVHAGIPPPVSGHPPRSRHPPEPDNPPGADRHPHRADTPEVGTPLEQTPPRSRQTPLQSMLGDTVNARAVRILLECKLFIYVFEVSGIFCY